MKKYFLGLLAVVLAISFSAFTYEPKKEVANSTTESYWYVVDDEGLLTAEFNGGEPLTREDAISASTSCVDDAGIECLRGYSAPLDNPQFPIANPAEGDDESIFKN